MIGICRLCATVKRKETLIVITSEEDELCARVSACCGVHIKMTDDLPKVVCQECANTLEYCYKFYKKVQDAQDSLELLFPKQGHTSDLKAALKNLPPEHSSNSVNVKIKIEGDMLPAAAIVQSLPTAETELKKCLPADIVEALDYEEFLNATNQAEQTRDDATTEEECLTDNSMNSVECESSTQDDETMENYEVDIEPLYEVHEESNNSTNSTTEDLMEPIASDWSTYPWECQLCQTVYTKYVDLKNHAITAHDLSADKITLKCVDCQKICAKYFNFINHVRFQHRRELCLVCDACNLTFENFSKLANHREICYAIVADELPVIAQCKLCGRAYSNVFSAQVHYKNAHMNERNLVCCYCEKVFKREKALKMHKERVHEGVKEYQCHLCEASFGQKINLQNHLVSHTDVKAYTCSVCNKKYKTASNLQKHALLHSEPKQFKCDYCDNYFRTKDAKQSHERIHTGEKPYKCQYCARRFRYRSVFKAHINTHTGARPYSCTDCDHHFTNWSNYNKHLKRRHNTTATEHSKKAASSVTQANVGNDNSENSEETLLNIVFEDNTDSTTTEYRTAYSEDDANNE